MKTRQARPDMRTSLLYPLQLDKKSLTVMVCTLLVCLMPFAGHLVVRRFLETLYFGVVPAFVALTFVIEIIIDFLQAIMPRQSSFTATVVKCVTCWVIGSVAIAAVACSFPAPLAKELLIVSSLITLLVRYYIARMRHLRASVWLMLSPLAVITLPYVLYALFCKESLPDHLTNQ